jgi:CRP-like cAMP-binding protein
MLEPAETVKVFQARSTDTKTYKPGEVIFEIGQPGEYMFGILEGEVDMVVNGQAVETLKTGDVFGEGALVHPDGTRAATATAKTECKLASINREHFLFAVQETPMFALKVMQSYSNRMRLLKQML